MALKLPEEIHITKEEMKETFSYEVMKGINTPNNQS